MNLSDLRTALQERREDFSQSSAKLNRRVNQAYLDICSRRKWGWLRRTHTYRTFGTEAYTVTVNQNSHMVGVTSAILVADEMVVRGRPLGKRVRIGNQTYTITGIELDPAAVPAFTEFWTLDQPYIGAGGTQTATVYHDQIALPTGAERIVKALIVGDTTFTADQSGSTSSLGNTGLIAVSPADMSVRSLTATGRPTRYSVIRKGPLPAPVNAPTFDSMDAATTPRPIVSGSVYYYLVSTVDVRTGAESALSPPLKIDNTDGSLGTGCAVLGHVASTHGLAQRVYRSRDGGNTPYMKRSEGGGATTEHHAVSTNHGTWPITDNIEDVYLGKRAPDSASSMYMTLWTAPSTAYQVHILYQIEAQKMVEDEDVPLFDATFHNLILDGAEALMLEAEDEQGRASQARQRFELGIARMITNDRLDANHTVVMGGRRRISGKPQAWHGSWDGTGP